MPMTPLAFIDQYLARYQSHNPALWNYEDGCVLTGCRQLYQATGRRNTCALCWTTWMPG